MNTDKLMELERKWRAEAEQYKQLARMADDAGFSKTAYERRGIARDYTMRADELAAALRAEQAVGEEQIARELAEIATWHRRMNLELSGKGSEWAAKEMYACRHGKFAETLERALGTARQSEGVVLVSVPPANCRQRLKHEGKPYPRSSCEVCGKFSPNWRQCDAVLHGLAAAPGGEGEG